MYKVVVVDDEKWIVEGLKAGVDWHGHGFKVVGDADNGQKALELIENLKPDVVFTDIRMPGLNGLELIKEAKEKLPDSIFIVLSGYAEFAYAQKAINYGTFGYCLKPFEIDEIHNMLSRISKALAERNTLNNPVNSNQLYEIICSGSPESIQRNLTSYGMPLDGKSKITPVVVIGKEPLDPALFKQVRCLEFKMGATKSGYLIYNLDHDIVKETLENRSGDIQGSLGIGYSITDISALEPSIEAATLASYSMFSLGKPNVYSYTSVNDSHMEKVASDISDSLKRKDRIQFVQGIETARDFFHKGTLSIKSAYLLFNMVTCNFYSEASNCCEKFLKGYEQLYKHFETADTMLDYLKEHTLKYFSPEASDSTSDVEHSTVKKILKYINDNFTNDISINDLSEKFFLNPNYVCQLFKKEVGESFIEYISRRRIEYACRLLAETSLSVNQISEKCGFNDYFYFTRIFKKFSNMTPTQYRDQNIVK